METPKHTIILSSQDIHKIVSHFGLDSIMKTLIKQLEKAVEDFNPKQTVIPIRSGFNYKTPHLGLIEWMPLHQKAQHVVMKVVGYHPENPKRYDLPTILSTISVYDTQTGHLVGIADGVFLTALRTGAASAIASRFLAKPDSKTLGLIGCGAQAITQLHALSTIFDIKNVLIYDIDTPTMLSFSARCTVLNLNVEFTPSSVEEIVEQSDILCTATSIEVAEGPLFEQLPSKNHLHINAVGADFPGKVELPLDFLTQSFVCPDFKAQAMIEGECQRLKDTQIHAEIIDVVKTPSAYKIYQQKRTVYDSTGWALQDAVVMELFMDYAKMLKLGQYVEIEYMPKDAKNPYDFIFRNEKTITTTF